YLNGNPIEHYTSNKIIDYREKVINSTKINSTSNFYKHPTEIGKLEYFSILKIPLSASDELTLILNFTNKVFSPDLPFPILLGANNSEAPLREQNFGENSYAFYKNGNLITQNGKYIYPSTDASFPRAIEKYIVLNEDNRFIQIMYRPNAYTTIIVSKEKQSYWEFIALASSSFLLLYVITTLINFLLAIIPVFRSQDLSIRHLVLRLYQLRQNIRYSTRIQTLVISSVLLAVIISGIIAFISISYQSEENRKNEKIEHISEIVNKIESNIYNSATGVVMHDIEDLIKNLSDVLPMDFN